MTVDALVNLPEQRRFSKSQQSVERRGGKVQRMKKVENAYGEPTNRLVGARSLSLGYLFFHASGTRCWCVVFTYLVAADDGLLNLSGEFNHYLGVLLLVHKQSGVTYASNVWDCSDIFEHSATDVESRRGGQSVRNPPRRFVSWVFIGAVVVVT